MNLYEIESAILNCIDEETGEIINEAKLNELEMEKSQKLENVACWIKNLTAEADALDKEAYTLKQRQKVCENKIESLKKYIAYGANGVSFKSARCAVSFRRTESVDIIDEAAIPEEFMKVTVTKAPMKVAIKEAIKSGTEVPGTGIKTNVSVIVK